MQQVLKYEVIIIISPGQVTQGGLDHWFFDLSATLLPPSVDIWLFYNCRSHSETLGSRHISAKK